MLIADSRPLCAISYETVTFNILKKFLALTEGRTIDRLSPDDFYSDHSTEFQYINLVIKDFDEREKVSNFLDQHNLSRFTYIYSHNIQSNFPLEIAEIDHHQIGAGCFIYPYVYGYKVTIGNDVIIHSMAKFAENVSIGSGTFISGNVTVAGDCTIGKWCYLGTNVLTYDHVTIPDHSKILPATVIRKSLKKSGTYYNPGAHRIQELKNF